MKGKVIIMMKKVNWKELVKKIIMTIFYIMLIITMMGIAGEIYDDYNFDHGIIKGIIGTYKELTSEEGYIQFTLLVCIIYTFMRLTEKMRKLFARKEKKEES